MRHGICMAGNMSVDIMYTVNGWPQLGELTHINDGISKTTGGLVCNSLIDIARLAPNMPLYAAGRNGSDDNGRFILDQFHRYPNIDTSGIINEGIASFTHAVSDTTTHERVFFTYPGATARFDIDDIDLKNAPYSLLHVGYILLLNTLDQEDDVYGTRFARLLHDAQSHGIRTSLDVVSENSDRFRRLVPPALRYADYCIINEYEAEHSTGVPLRDADGTLLRKSIPSALRKLREMGVSTWAVIHAPEGGFGLDEEDRYIEVPGYRLPDGYIRSTTGAGDAFCAGVLCAAERGKSLTEALTLGNATAAVSLGDDTATEGIGTEAEVLAAVSAFPRSI